MYRFFKRAKGSITIFLTLILLPTMTGAGMIVDGARIAAAKTALSGAGDLAMNAALSEFDQTLFDVYGIFAISENMEELQDNVNIYFRNTINNSGILTDSDSYTREFINSIFSSLSSTDMEFSNVVDIQADSDMTLTGIPGSAVANPTVLERQIIDFMKYRGPINIVKGLLTKLKCIGESSKQTAAVEAKVSYDRKLSTVQDACNTLYNDLNDFNDYVTKSELFKDQSAGYLAKIDQDIAAARDKIAELAEYGVALADTGLTTTTYYNSKPSYLDAATLIFSNDDWAKARRMIKYDAKIWDELEKNYNNSTSEVKATATLDYIIDKLNGWFTLSKSENPAYKTPYPPNGDNTAFYEKALLFASALNSLNSNNSSDRKLGGQINVINAFNEIPASDMLSVLTYLMAYEFYCEKLDDDEKAANDAREKAASAEVEKEYQEAMKVYEKDLADYEKAHKEWEKECEEAAENDEDPPPEPQKPEKPVKAEVEYEKVEVPTDYKDRASSEGQGMISGIILVGSSLGPSYRDEWTSIVNEDGKAAADLLFKWQKEADTISGKLQKAIESSNALIEKIKELKTSRENWKGKIDTLSESDVKSTMNGDYENSAKDLNETVVNTLKNIIQSDKDHFDKISAALKGIKFVEQSVCVDSANVSFSSTYNGKLTAASEKTYASVQAQAQSLMNSKYVSQTVSGIDPGKYRVFNDIDNDMQFYAYLKRVCTSAAKSTDTTAQENGKALKDNLTAKAKEGNVNSEPANLSSLKGKTVSGSLGDVSKDIDGFGSAAAGDDAPKGYSPGKPDGDDDKAAEAQENNLSAASSLIASLGNLSNLIETMRDKVYIEEYMTEMFSCLTDTVHKEGEEASAKSMNNQEMSGNVLFGAEQEYILWGSNNVMTNVNSTKGVIFGIRFALNAIFAMTNSTTRSPALAAATAIAGWTGFGVPIVQTVILLAWAMAESFVDLDRLCEGKDVAVYKNADTWTLGVGGMKMILEEKAEEVVDDVFAKVDELIDDGTGKIAAKATDFTSSFTKNTKESVLSSVKSALSVPIEQLAMRLSGAVTSLTDNEISAMVQETLSGIKSNAGSGLVGECIAKAVDSLSQAAMKNKIVAAMKQIYEDAKNGDTVSAINKELYGEDGNSGIIGEIFTDIEGAINDKIDGYIKKFEDDVNEKLKGATADAKDAVKDRISEFTAGIGGGEGGASATTGGTTSASGFTMNYQEYVKAFYLIGLAAGQDSKMVSRAARLIQLNVQQKESGFNVTKAYTMVQSSATIQVRTTFMNIFTTVTNEDGTETTSIDYSAIGSDWHKLTYRSALGY